MVFEEFVVGGCEDFVIIVGRSVGYGGRCVDGWIGGFVGVGWDVGSGKKC